MVRSASSLWRSTSGSSFGDDAVVSGLERGDVVGPIGWALGQNGDEPLPFGEELFGVPEVDGVAGVDGEALFALALQRGADGVGRRGEGFGWAVAGGVVGGGGAEEVEVVRDAAAAHADVAAFAEQFIGAEEKASVDSGALGLVNGGGVAVGEVTGVDVVGR